MPLLPGNRASPKGKVGFYPSPFVVPSGPPGIVTGKSAIPAKAQKAGISIVDNLGTSGVPCRARYRLMINRTGISATIWPFRGRESTKGPFGVKMPGHSGLRPSAQPNRIILRSTEKQRPAIWISARANPAGSPPGP